MRAGTWIDQIMDSVGRHFWVETSDGVVREGKISGITTRSMSMNDQSVEMPIEIEVNGDPNDRIPLDRMARFKVY